MSGLRWGEATALQRKDLRSEGDHIVVSVYKDWKQLPGGKQLGVPKTKASVRDISLSKDFSKKLIKHVKTIKIEDFIFSNPLTGGSIS